MASKASKRVLFIQPPFYRFIGMRTRYFPHHLICLATHLSSHGHEAQVLDTEVSHQSGSLDFTDMESRYCEYLNGVTSHDHPLWSDIARRISAFKPDYIGITVWTTFVASALRTAEICRRVCPEAKIIAGGPHVTLLPEDLIRTNTFDVVVIGEGEQTLFEIVSGKSLGEIKGIAYRTAEGWRRTEPRPFAQNLDEFGIPRRELLLDERSYTPEDMGLIMTSRGCPYSCAYCATSLWRHILRSRSVDNVLEEMRLVNERYGTRYYSLKDDVLTVNRKWLTEFCQRLPGALPRVFWECNAHLRTIDAGILRMMRKAGCIAVKVGVESGSDRIHRIVNKGLTNELVRTKMKELCASGMHVTCYFMMGIPGETKEDIMATVDLAKVVRPDYVSMSVYEIFPGTKLHEIGVQDGTAIDHMEVEDYFKVYPHNYYFKNHKRHLASMNDEDFDNIQRQVKQVVNKYNRSPRSIYSRVRSRMPLYKTNPRSILNDFGSFLRWI